MLLCVGSTGYSSHLNPGRAERGGRPPAPTRVRPPYIMTAHCSSISALRVRAAGWNLSAFFAYLRGGVLKRSCCVGCNEVSISIVHTHVYTEASISIVHTHMYTEANTSIIHTHTHTLLFCPFPPRMQKSHPPYYMNRIHSSICYRVQNVTAQHRYVQTRTMP